MSLDKYIEVPLTKLVLAEWNYKEFDDQDAVEMMEDLKNNLKKNDQIENLIVRQGTKKGFFEVVNGNHRLIALQEIKKKTAICYNLGKITQEDAERIAVETNETRFEKDQIKFAETISKLTKKFDIEELVSTLPLNREEVDSYAKLLEFDWSQFDPSDEEPITGGDDSGPDEDWTTVEFRLPNQVAELLQLQISRVKKALYPDKDEDNVSIVTVIECIVCNVAEIPDELLAGE